MRRSKFGDQKTWMSPTGLMYFVEKLQAAHYATNDRMGVYPDTAVDVRVRLASEKGEPIGQMQVLVPGWFIEYESHKGEIKWVLDQFKGDFVHASAPKDPIKDTGKSAMGFTITRKTEDLGYGIGGA